MTSRPPAPPSPLPPLTAEELRRYGRHLSLARVGETGQRRLKAARVLIVGAGGLGSPAALYLAAAGVGTIGIVDHDVVETSNLQRQILHDATMVGRAKVDSARARLADLNPLVQVETHETALTPANARELVRAYDCVLDGSDNFATRYLVNDACVLERRPDVYASVFQFEGQASVFAAEGGPCYRCLFPDFPSVEIETCAEAGVLGVLPGMLGIIQATEALKLILGQGEPLIGRMLIVDALEMSTRSVPIRRDPACPACGTDARDALAPSYDATCERESATGDAREISPRDVARRMAAGDDLVLLDVRERAEWDLVRIDGARLVPLGELAAAMPTLDASREIVVYCKGGGRSARAARQLAAAGFQRVWNLAGGILAWRAENDPEMPGY